MSSIFEVRDRVCRLRQTFSYFRNAAILTGSEIRHALRSDVAARDEWASLLSEVRGCLMVLEAAAPEEKSTGKADFDQKISPAWPTRH